MTEYCIAALLLAVAANGALQRLEPTGHRVLHGCQQPETDFKGYSEYLPQNTKPMFYTMYEKIQKFNQTGAGVSYFENMGKSLDDMGDASHLVLLHMAVSFTPSDPVLDQVIAGDYDLGIAELAKGLAHMGRPVFLRLGYEFNGHWNNYDPAKYKKMFQRVADKLAEDTATRAQLALIWDLTCNEKVNTDWTQYYPGDDYVDWWAVNVLDPGNSRSAPTSTCVTSFIADAAKHSNKPVMIAESMPRDTGVEGESSWQMWFAPYFHNLLNHTNVKAFSYINRDCRPTSKMKCVGGTWGTSRLEDSKYGLGDKYKAALNDTKFVHAGTLQETCQALNVPSCSAADVTV